jgi:hypothetical protein
MDGAQLAEMPGRRAPRGADPNTASTSIWSDSSALLVIALTAIGLVARVVIAHESLFGDELSTYWIVRDHSLHGVLSLIYGTSSFKHAEITPPLSFVASWLTLHIANTPIGLRLPSLIAGMLTIPAVYLIGCRTVGRRAALAATALTTVAPFMVYYSTEARAYGVMMALVLGSTLSMLLALDRGHKRWWVSYAVCEALAIWTHNTSAFVLAVQFVWLLWAHPQRRREVLTATIGAAALVAPWLPGLINQLQSPTVNILNDLSPFTPGAVRVILEHWSIGYPYTAIASLTQVPGRPGLVAIGFAVVTAAAGLVWRYRRGVPSVRLPDRQNRVVLVVAVALATPVLEALYSLVSTHLFGVRNLAASWPYAALVAGAIAIAAGRRAGVLAAALAVIGLALGTERMVVGDYGRPDFGAAGSYIDAHWRRGDVVIDETGRYLTPGPLTGLDVTLHRPIPTVRALVPAERAHPFTFADRFVPVSTATAQAVAQVAPGHVIFLVGGDSDALTLARNGGAAGVAGVRGFKRIGVERYLEVTVQIYSRSAAGRG